MTMTLGVVSVIYYHSILTIIVFSG
jgi:hypothetical protein